MSIMFDHYTEDRVKAQFSPRDLKAFAVNPIILKPTHFGGQEGYISDTETAPQLCNCNMK
ncbi:Procollagen galactosyltransferase 1 [Armadillidium vulgare]|nr:Procollagen galactosyltransferase 1 [Armadillidium vulgare]